MKQWTVTYREKSGVKTSVIIEAEDRAGVFAELKQRGINAISITEGAVKAKRNARGGVSKGVWGVVAAGVVAAVVGVVWMMMPEEEKPEVVKDTKPKVVHETTYKPAKSKPVKEEKSAEPEPVKVDPNARPTKPFEKVNGYIKLPSGRVHKLSTVVLTNDFNVTSPRPAYAIFNSHVENQISSLITLPLGGTLVGSPNYGDRFVEDFLESLKTPIVIEEGDDAETIALKKAMIDAKRDLKARYDAGEDIATIMNNTHAELQKLALVKKNLMEEIYKVQRDPEATMEDVDLVIKAVNNVLEKDGIAPIEMNPVVRQSLKYHKEGK